MYRLFFYTILFTPLIHYFKKMYGCWNLMFENESKKLSKLRYDPESGLDFFYFSSEYESIWFHNTCTMALLKACSFCLLLWQSVLGLLVCPATTPEMTSDFGRRTRGGQWFGAAPATTAALSGAPPLLRVKKSPPACFPPSVENALLSYVSLVLSTF